MKADNLLNFIEKLKPQKEFNWEKFVKSHAPKQIEYINSKARTTMAYGGKRSGKTLASTSMCIIMDQKRTDTDARIEIASATIEKAKLLYWRKFQIANKSLNLKWEFKTGESMIVTPRREIVFRSLRDIGNADKSVGFSVLAAFIEEPHTLREKVLKHYLDNVMRANLLNIRGARVNITTNPPPYPLPFLTQRFYENPEVKKVHFQPKDNPWVKKKMLKLWLEEEAKELGYDSVEEALEKSNEIKRNILGMWVHDMGRVIFNQNKVQFFEKPPEDLRNYDFVIGVDIGGGRARDAIVVICYNKYERKAWVIYEKEYETEGEDIETLATELKRLYEKYRPHAIALDHGGVGARIAVTLTTRYGVPCVVPAIKKDKMAHLEEMKAEINRGRLMFKDDSEFYQEMPQIIYTEDHTEVDDENGLHSDLMDACLYAMRYVWNAWPKEKAKEKTYKEKRIEELLKKHKKTNRVGY